ncbi:hypothetical protein VTK73DRAFT_8387 [Phialemonium thermophilum]|uniref:RRM domain-containing protein n=1 Tax=Phialemonium thermophilum TaxID=223376 RepID=A0ABR3XQ55_9PEZI
MSLNRWHRRREFVPMLCRLHPGAAKDERSRQVPLMEALARIQDGFSPNYGGNRSIPANRSADIPPEQNCSLFIVNLPPNITTREVLQAIRGCGRIFTTHLMTPEPEKGNKNPAIKITFFEREPASLFYNKCRHNGGFLVPGHPERGHVMWNRVLCAPRRTTVPPHLYNPDESRVVGITGPPGIVNEDTLRVFLDHFMEYELLEVRDISTSAMPTLEYHFGSFRSQAEVFYMAARHHLARFGARAWYRPDPCACP